MNPQGPEQEPQGGLPPVEQAPSADAGNLEGAQIPEVYTVPAEMLRVIDITPRVGEDSDIKTILESADEADEVKLAVVRERINNVTRFSEEEIKDGATEKALAVFETLRQEGLAQIKDPGKLERMEDLFAKGTSKLSQALRLGVGVGGAGGVVGAVTGSVVGVVAKKGLKLGAEVASGALGGAVGGLFGFIGYKKTFDSIGEKNWMYESNPIYRAINIIPNLLYSPDNQERNLFKRIAKARELRDNNYLLSHNTISEFVRTNNEGVREQLPADEIRSRLAQAHIYKSRAERRGEELSETERKLYKNLLINVLKQAGLTEEDISSAMQSEIDVAKNKRAKRSRLSVVAGAVGAIAGGVGFGWLANKVEEMPLFNHEDANDVAGGASTGAGSAVLSENVSTAEIEVESLSTNEQINLRIFNQFGLNIDENTDLEKFNELSAKFEEAKRITAQLRLANEPDPALVEKLNELNSELSQSDGPVDFETMSEAASAIRAQLAEDILQSKGIDVDIINEAGEIDMTSLKEHLGELGTIDATDGNGVLVFNPNLTLDQNVFSQACAEVLGSPRSGLNGFVDYKVDQLMHKVGIQEGQFADNKELAKAIKELKKEFLRETESSAKSFHTGLGSVWQVDADNNVIEYKGLNENFKEQIQKLLDEKDANHGLKIKDVVEQKDEIVAKLKEVFAPEEAPETPPTPADRDSNIWSRSRVESTEQTLKETTSDGFINQLFGLNEEPVAVVERDVRPLMVSSEGDSIVDVEGFIYKEEILGTEGPAPELELRLQLKVNAQKGGQLSNIEAELFGDDTAADGVGIVNEKPDYQTQLDKPSVHRELTEDAPKEMLEAKVDAGEGSPSEAEVSNVTPSRAEVESAPDKHSEPELKREDVQPRLNIPEDNLDRRYPHVYVNPEMIEEAEREAAKERAN